MADPRTRFDRVMVEVFRHEGGYVDHPRDPGGATNMGITHLTLANWRDKAVSKDDVRQLTRAEASDIYRSEYWNKVRGDELPAGLDYVAMDGAVNSGPRRGITWLQRGLSAAGATISVDGGIGSQTIAAAENVRRDGKVPEAIRAACAARLRFKRSLSIWTTFGRGWSRRVAEVEAKATAWALEAQGVSARQGLIQRENEALRAQRGAERGAGATVLAVPPAGVGVDQAVDAVAWSWLPVVVIGAMIVVVIASRVVVQRQRVQAFRQAALEART